MAINQEALELNRKWGKLIRILQKQFNKKARPDLNAVLFLIGVQELGKGMQSFSKEEKQDLLHIAICKVLSFSDFYKLEGLDEQGWPHWTLVKKLPHLDMLSQEKILKEHILEYFKTEVQLEGL